MLCRSKGSFLALFLDVNMVGVETVYCYGYSPYVRFDKALPLLLMCLDYGETNRLLS